MDDCPVGWILRKFNIKVSNAINNVLLALCSCFLLNLDYIINIYL